MESTEKRLTKGMAYVFIANMLNMVFNLLTNFLLPKFLSVESYAAVKTFQLYVNYVGVFHFGFVDGVYLKYGGRRLQEISEKNLSKSLATIRIFQAVVTVMVLGCVVISRDKVLLAFALVILPLNVVSYFRMLYQAIGEFKLYSKITNITTGLTFLANTILLLLVKTDNYMAYLLSYVSVDVLIWITLEHFFRRSLEEIPKMFTFSIMEFLENVKSGFPLMCGNLASFILTGMDRWFVKFTLDINAFAQYSFAVSIENMLNLAITPVTIPLYNYFCKEKETIKLRIAHKACTLFSVILISAAFIAEFVIEIVLKEYVSACKVIFLLFAAQAFQIVIKAIYVNLYKVRKLQRRYFVKLVLVIFSGALFNILCFSMVGVKEAYAWGTFLSAVLWFLISAPDFIELFDGRRDFAFLLLEVFVFLFCGFHCEAVVGFLIYGVVTCVLSCLFMGEFLTELLSAGNRCVKRTKYTK